APALQRLRAERSLRHQQRRAEATEERRSARQSGARLLHLPYLPLCRDACRRHGRHRWLRVHGRDRRKRSGHPRGGRTAARVAWPRAVIKSECQGRAQDFAQAIAGRLLRHPDRRGVDDCRARARRVAGAHGGRERGKTGMIDLASLTLLKGKKALVTGIANDQSIAWGCAKAFQAFGADLAITYHGEKTKRYVDPLAKQVEASIYMPLDVQKPGDLEAVFDAIKKKWGRLDIVLHSIAFAPKGDLQGRVVDCSKEGFLLAMDLSCWSFIGMAKL